MKCWEETQLRSSKENSRYHFEVRDTGIGIEEKDQERLFRPFQQAESQPILSREHSGKKISQHLSITSFKQI